MEVNKYEMKNLQMILKEEKEYNILNENRLKKAFIFFKKIFVNRKQ